MMTEDTLGIVGRCMIKNWNSFFVKPVLLGLPELLR